MGLKFFCVAALRSEDGDEELNAFLQGHRVLSLERQLVTTPEGPFWCIAVEFVERRASGAAAAGDGKQRRPRIDYREVLSPEDFGRFSKLREVRKELAKRDSLPVYAIYTNEQLAQIAKDPPRTLAALGKIEGVGDSKVARFGQPLLDALRQSDSSDDPAPTSDPLFGSVRRASRAPLGAI